MKNDKKKKIVFLCSGGGGNLRFIHHAIERGWIQEGRIVAVLTDRECQANHFATSVGVENRSIEFNGPDHTELLEQLGRFSPDLIVTTVHKILGKPVVEQFRNKLINLHYSLLPAFGGLIGAQPVRAAIDYGAKFTGVTVHLVDESLDGGYPIVQAVMPLLPEERDFDLLMNLVFRCGCMALMSAINLCLNGDELTSKEGAWGKFAVIGRACLFSVNVPHANEILDEHLWQVIASK